MACCEQQPGNDIACTQITVSGRVCYFPLNVFINANSCRMFLRKKEYWYFTNPDFPLGWRDRTTLRTYQVGSQVLSENVSFTSDIAAGLPLPETKPWNFYDFTRSATGYSYKFNYGNTIHSITVTFEQEVSMDELLSRHVTLENYVVANYATLFGLAWTYGLNYQITRYLTNVNIGVTCGTSALAPPISGYTRSIGPTVTNADLTEYSEPGWHAAVVSQYSWFAKARMTRNYRVTEYSVTSRDRPAPAFCGSVWQLSPFNGAGSFGQSASTFACTQTRSTFFSDGLDQNGNPRELLFGPTSRTPHITTVACRTA